MKEHIRIMKEELEAETAQMFDVREEEEWMREHLQIATLVPLSSLVEGVLSDGLDKEKKTYLHCRSGNRVFTAAPILKQMGFKEIIPLKEGFEELASYGFDTE